MKIVFGFLSVIFLLFAAVQYNDPDPIMWIIYYLGISILTGAMAIGKYFKWLTITLAAVSILGLVYYFPGVYDWGVHHDLENIAQQMKADKPYIEETREFFGILISLAGIGIVYWKRND